MATKGSFTLTGLSAYIEEISSAGLNVDEAVQDVMVEAGAEVRDAMTAAVPVDTGNLQSHISVEGPKQEGNFSYVEVGVMNADKDTAIYGNVIEYGSTRQAAQPYIRPTLKSKKSVIKKALIRVLEKYGLSV
jgi:HK97 gp10 family phage protein